LAQAVTENPLGKTQKYPLEYAPEHLFSIPRATSRNELFTTHQLPFRGEDIWNAWELSWLDQSFKPVIAKAVLRIPADSPNLIESKSLKLYLNSHASCRYADKGEISTVIARDLQVAAGVAVNIMIDVGASKTNELISDLPGTCIDDQSIDQVTGRVDASVLRTEPQRIASETLYSQLLRSNCPVTGQPDTGSILIRYEGAQIVQKNLLEYIVSYRYHDAFHEDCIERIFVDIKAQCAPHKLTVYARYTRRGGLDINPFRSDFEDSAENLRLWRQ
jgi:7-cyano-7-deazaguanine reductase